MKSIALAAALLVGTISTVCAQDPDDPYPLSVGMSWTYELTITRGEKSHSIRYATRAVREETLDGVECVVLETKSGKKLLRTAWVTREDGVVREWQTSSQNGALVQKLREQPAEGEAESTLGRILLDTTKLQAGAKWSWTSLGGEASGTIAVLGSAELNTPALGKLTCVQLEEQGEFRRGEKTAQQVRQLWFAPGYGLVREVSTITLPDGRETTSTATLLARPKADQ